ncbi:MAG: outer membrane beta-barrel protein [Chitinophagaceae bacterium]|nr:outer membrane beta-barrel protein [Chitinophagaceae bacterium]MCW5926458.1 outer membrane beta-barrel protein [Chitinophagaceae bacterium]
MKKILSFVIAFFALVSTNQLYAQKDGKQFSFGFGIEGGAMVGDENIKEAFSSQFGLSLRFSYKVGPGYVTFTPGGSLMLPKKVDEDNVKIGTNVPLKLGYKYIIAEKFFVMGEAGYSIYNFYSASMDEDVDIDDISKERIGGFTYAPSIGANLGKFEVGVRYESTILKKNGVTVKPSLLALRLGFNF